MYIFSLDINTISCTIKSQADIISRNIKDKGVKIGTLYAKKQKQVWLSHIKSSYLIQSTVV